MFGFGETLLQPTIPAITNDLAPDHLRGRYNALSAGCFQIGGIVGPIAAGVLLRHHQEAAFIVLLVAGCLAVLALARVLEARIPPAANGIQPGIGSADATPLDPQPVVERPHPAVDTV
jgi:MFS family permease